MKRRGKKREVEEVEKGKREGKEEKEKEERRRRLRDEFVKTVGAADDGENRNTQTLQRMSLVVGSIEQ